MPGEDLEAKPLALGGPKHHFRLCSNEDGFDMEEFKAQVYKAAFSESRDSR